MLRYPISKTNMHNELVHTDQFKPIKDPRIKIKQKKEDSNFNNPYA